MERNKDEYMRFGTNVLLRMRETAKISQMEMSNRLGVAISTVCNWESGRSCPDVIQEWAWFHACGIDPTPYLMAWQHPKRYAIAEIHDDEPLLHAIALMTNDDKDRLLYLLTGNHGSCPRGLIQLLLCHIHLPLKARIADATIVKTQYNIAKGRSTLVYTDKPMPDDELLDLCIQNGMLATLQGKEFYSLEGD